MRHDLPWMYLLAGLAVTVIGVASWLWVFGLAFGTFRSIKNDTAPPGELGRSGADADDD